MEHVEVKDAHRLQGKIENMTGKKNEGGAAYNLIN